MTLLAARTSHRILHHPVVCASFTSVTDGQNTMVETRTASTGEYARGVRLKRVLVCLNGNGHRLLCHCQHRCLLAVGRHVRIIDDSTLRNAHLVTRQVTSSVCCSVRVQLEPAQCTPRQVQRTRMASWRQTACQ